MLLDEQLLGRWKAETGSPYHVAVQEFFPNGMLLYATRQGGQTAVLELTYRVDGQYLVTNQPSAPREERTRILIDDAGRLVVGEGNSATTFVRAPLATLTDR